jgi:hypothetical protein
MPASVQKKCHLRVAFLLALSLNRVGKMSANMLSEWANYEEKGVRALR